MKIKLIDIANEVGISVSTVSRVVNGKDLKSASPDTVKKIRDAIDKLGYVPQQNTMTNLEKAKKQSDFSIVKVGVILGSSREDKYNHSFFSQIYKGIEEALHREGYVVDFYYTIEEIMKTPIVYHSIMSSNVNALIIIDEMGQMGFVEIKKKFQYIVNISTQNYPLIKNDYVLVDAYDMLKEVLNELIRTGRKRIVLLGGNYVRDILPGTSPNLLFRDRRYAAYSDALVENGYTLESELIYDAEWDAQKAHNITEEIINRGVFFDAVFAADDMMAVACLRVLQNKGVRVPDDVAVVGFDNLPVSAYSTPPLSTIHIPREELGKTAVQILKLRMENKLYCPVKVHLPAELIIRESCGIK